MRITLFVLWTALLCCNGENSQRNEKINPVKSSNRNVLAISNSNAQLRGGQIAKEYQPELIARDEFDGGLHAETEDIDNLGGSSRTATGGFVNTIMVALTIFAFLGNGAFMVYVFWLSK